jgi:hypothetical protein
VEDRSLLSGELQIVVIVEKSQVVLDPGRAPVGVVLEPSPVPHHDPLLRVHAGALLAVDVESTEAGAGVSKDIFSFES